MHQKLLQNVQKYKKDVFKIKSKKRKFNGAKNRTDGKLSSHTIHDDESTKENSEIKKPMKKLIK